MFKRLGAFFLDILEVVVFAVGIFFFVYLLIMRPHRIKGASMTPNYPDGQYLLTERVTYYLREPERGDVVVFTPPVSELDEYIKRVVVLPGERVMINGGRVFINGELLEEEYIGEDTPTPSGSFLKEGIEYTVPEGQYMLFGDNRVNSSDSRNWGPVVFKSISGRAWVVYWPLKDVGTVHSPKYSF
ncbi:MAG TPA: signal peptidase I [Patescibacteria group bacterium]|nr:signal peptidase I [Patescibacteria group bacterium]